MMTQKSEYKCHLCEGIFTSGWSKEEAINEAKENGFRQDLEKGEVGSVCDACYQKIKELYPFLK